MKKYKLKRWYPSLDVTLSVGDIIELTGRFKSFIGGGKYEFIHKTGDYSDVGFIKKCELNNPDFWELIEEEKPKPLFITDDGVEINKNYGGWLYRISKDFKREVLPISHEMEVEGYKVFAHPENADEYITWFKKEFSINDLLLADVGITTSQLDKLQELAKERAGYEK